MAEANPKFEDVDEILKATAELRAAQEEEHKKTKKLQSELRRYQKRNSEFKEKIDKEVKQLDDIKDYLVRKTGNLETLEELCEGIIELDILENGRTSAVSARA